ncbi:hypothetical protein ACQKP0_20630 [Heyndrickxia sp. NPDC080065]|uniref:hypothetical protein n=1 Tax=Heyndrickxia sp. NPDC080065 TaxID=3390568 RepID=UPI003D04A5C5
MSKHFLSAAIIILSLSIIYCGMQIGISNSNQKNKKEVSNLDKGLLTIEETAKYLSMSVDQLEEIIFHQDIERADLTSFDIYEFIPYIKVNDEKYFNKVQVNEWIKYNATEWAEINY